MVHLPIKQSKFRTFLIKYFLYKTKFSKGLVLKKYHKATQKYLVSDLRGFFNPMRLFRNVGSIKDMEISKMNFWVLKCFFYTPPLGSDNKFYNLSFKDNNSAFKWGSFLGIENLNFSSLIRIIISTWYKFRRIIVQLGQRSRRLWLGHKSRRL